MRQLTTEEAAARLEVKPATLYAYVSRGLLTPTRTPEGSRYDAADVERLAQRSRRAKTSAPFSFVTGLTLIEGGTYRYRGLDAVELSRSRSFEEVATWLWSGEWPDASRPVWPAPQAPLQMAIAASAALDPSTAPADRWRVAVAAAASADPLRHDHSPTAVAATAQGLLSILVEVLPLVGPPATTGAGIAARLWPRLSPLPPGRAHLAALEAALVLMADHEMAASTLAARTAASFGADPYAVVLAGMAASSGPLHAASSLQVRPVLARAQRHGPAVALGEVLGRGGFVHGFGQALYPDGDPRAAELLVRIHDIPEDTGAVAALDELVALAGSRGMARPNCDLALAGLAQVTVMVPGASEAVFVLARTAGWLAHALEEYDQRTAFRARATYIGPR